MGSAISEYLSENYPVPVLKLGVNDRFGQSGPANELLDLYGMRGKDIAELAIKAISKK
jgi:transketolase